MTARIGMIKRPRIECGDADRAIVTAAEKS
jgi:hypothetical protein